MEVKKVEAPNVYITIGNLNLRYNYFWLRDHCRCNKCFDSILLQRSIHILNIPEDIKPLNVYVEDGNLQINWIDGHHSTYTAEFFLKNNYKSWLARKESNTRRYLWRGKEIENLVAAVERDEFLSSDECLKKVYESMLTYGVAFVDGVNPTIDDTEKVTTRFAPIMSTIFGTVWSILPNLEHKDAAYTQTYLPLHTDSTYFYGATGALMFHSLQEACEGGETTLRDGFEAITRVAAEYPKDVKLLSSKPVTAEYVEEGLHYELHDNIIRYDNATGDLEQIRYNIFDRSTLVSMPEEETLEYYTALRRLAKEIENKDAYWQFKLKPGRLMFFDNWRVLHGREAYTGTRHIAGSYLSRNDWISRARTFGLLR